MIHGLRFYGVAVKVERDGRAPIFVHNRLDEGRSDFDTIFSCLYEMLRGYVFADAKPGSFVSERDDYWVHALQTVPHTRARYAALMSASVLGEFGRRVRDDCNWNSALMFSPDVLSLPQMMEITEAALCHNQNAAFVDCEAAQLIFNLDRGRNVCWEIFCKDRRFCERLLEAHRGDERLRIYEVDFMLNYPDQHDLGLEAA